MKAIVFTARALKAFQALPKATRMTIAAKLERYAETGAGDLKALVGRPGVRLRIGRHRAVFVESDDEIRVFAVGDRRDVYDGEDAMKPQVIRKSQVIRKPQVIRTESGDELVVLTRRTYDALVAASGGEAAEDRAMARITDDYLAEEAAGRGAGIPFWFVSLVATHGSAITAARKHHGCTQGALAQVLDISQGHLSDIERGRRQPTDLQRTQIAAHTGVEAGWLV